MKRRLSAILLACALGAAAPAWAAQESPLTTAAMEAFWWGDFEALEKQNAALRQPGHIAADGSSDLEMFRIGVSRVIDHGDGSEAYLRELERQTLQWTQQYPRSALAHILYARVLAQHGWAYRGSAYARDVPPEAMAEFERYQQRAAEYLLKHADVALTDSYAHATLLWIGKGLSWDSKQMMAIEQAGVQRNPEDVNLYFGVIRSLLPKWGGDAATLERYIRRVSEQTRTIYGMGMYPRLYSLAADEQYGHRLFEDSNADWDMMKRGYEDMRSRYPSVIRTNRYAYMACLAKDKATLSALFDELGTNIEVSLWGANPQRNLEACKRLVNKT